MLKLICPTDDVAHARLVDAEGKPVVGDVTVEVHYKTHRQVDEHGNHSPWLPGQHPIYERDAQGNPVGEPRRAGVPAPIVTRCAVTITGAGGTSSQLADLEVAEGVRPFAWHHCRLEAR